MSVLGQLISRIPGLDDYNDQVKQNAALTGQNIQQGAQFMTLQGAMQDRAIKQAEAPLRSELLQAQVDETRAKAAKLKRMDALFQRVQAGGVDQMSPDQLEKIGQFLAMGEHPGAATILGIADKRRALASEKETMGSLRSQSVPISAAPTEADAVKALNENPSLRAVGFGDSPQTQVQRGGLFAPLMGSDNPAIAARAKMMQDAMDKSSPGTSSKYWTERADALAAQQASFEQQKALLGQRGDQAQAGRQFNVDNRASPTAKVPVGYRMAADGTSMERIPVVGGNKPSEDALTDDAWYSIINGKARPGSLPIGKDEGNAYRSQLREKISSIARDIGVSPERLASLGPENKAKFGALNAVEKDLAAIRPFDTMLDTNVKVAIDLAKKISRTDSQFVNKPITWLMANAGDNPDIAEYLFQIQTVKTEGARILNNPRLVGQLTDSARHEMGDVINGNMPLGQTERVLGRMLSDGKNRVRAIETEADTLRSDIRGSAKDKPQAAKPAASSATNPREVTLPNGQIKTFPTPAAAQAFRSAAGL